MKNILVTGGAGFIGSHTLVQLIKAGYTPIVVDNLCNSSAIALDRVEQITGIACKFYEADIRDGAAMDAVFAENSIDAVIHFAGLKAVGESVAKPLEYYQNNIGGTLTLVESMRKAGCKAIVFSSSATVYGEPAIVPIPETCPKGACSNPYGWTKSMIEQILTDLTVADPTWNVVLLRYFNPVGAHVSGLIGEDPKGIPNNLTPYITQVACGKLPYLRVFGDDYDTPDGTGIRDYIHVVDLAEGHVSALHWMEGRTGCDVFNLGTGQGYSVLEMLHAFEKAVGRPIPYQITERRAGDLPILVSDPGKAERELGWKARFGVTEMAADAWNWQSNNPEGFR